MATPDAIVDTAPDATPAAAVLDTVLPALCESWCATNTNDWDEKCSWQEKCSGCSDCPDLPEMCEAWCDAISRGAKRVSAGRAEARPP